jgi:hypothetical protein
VDDLRLNYELMRALDYIATLPVQGAGGGAAAVNPDMCSMDGCGRPATVYCEQDECSLCDAHRAATHVLPAHRAHSIVPLEHRDRLRVRPPTCVKHYMPLILWCSAHAQLCCVTCVAHADHRGCTVTTADEEAAKGRQRLGDLQDRAARCREDAQPLIDEAHRLAREVADTRAQRLAEARARCDEEVRAAHQRRQQVEDEVEQHAAADAKNLDLRLQEVVTAVSIADAAREESRAALKLPDHQLLPVINQRILRHEAAEQEVERVRQARMARLNLVQQSQQQQQPQPAQVGAVVQQAELQAQAQVNAAPPAAGVEQQGQQRRRPQQLLRTLDGHESPAVMPMQPEGMTVDNAGTVYISDSVNDRVLVFDVQGAFVRAFGSKGANNGQFNGPGGMCVHGNLLFIADLGNHRIQVCSCRPFACASVHGHALVVQLRPSNPLHCCSHISFPLPSSLSACCCVDVLHG